jgi:hypothetical protein
VNNVGPFPFVVPLTVIPSGAQRSRGTCGASRDQQIIALWEWTRTLKDSYDDMNFTPPLLSRITASTLIVYADRDPLPR